MNEKKNESLLNEVSRETQMTMSVYKKMEVKNKFLRNILIFVQIISSFNALFSQEVVYDFPKSVQKKIEAHILTEKIDSTKQVFLLLDYDNNDPLLSYHRFTKKYNDTLVNFIKHRNIFANICGKLYPLLFFYDFMYSRNLNYKIDEVYSNNAYIPPSNFYIKFRGRMNSEGEIIE